MNIDPDAALDYLGFVQARHEVWEARQAGAPQPWTGDPIVASKKFTCVFRVLDYGSQYVLTDLVDLGVSDRDLLMRLFLYRHTGRVESWEYLEMELGGMPTVDSLEECRRILKEYRGGRSRPIFTSAYLVFPQSAVPGTDKLDSIIDLTKRLFDPASPHDLVPDFLAARTQADRFAVLRRNKGVADFMSMQILTDWGYAPHAGEDREDEFVVPGPGAKRGAAALDPGSRPLEVLHWAYDAVHALPDPPAVEGRLPSMMDTQNTLCEFSKYVKLQGKPLPKHPYSPAHPGPQPAPVLPAAW